jgi:hypothetical protein
MSDMFNSFVAIATHQPKVSGKDSERAPGISGAMKEGIWNERASAPTGVNHPYPLQASMNAVVIP